MGSAKQRCGGAGQKSRLTRRAWLMQRPCMDVVVGTHAVCERQVGADSTPDIKSRKFCDKLSDGRGPHWCSSGPSSRKSAAIGRNARRMQKDAAQTAPWTKSACATVSAQATSALLTKTSCSTFKCLQKY